MTDDSALPSWIVSASSATQIQITPTAGSVMSSNPWVVKVVYTPTAGSNAPAYTAVTITVTCEITSFALSGAGTTSVSYNTFETMKVIDGSTLTFT